MSLPTDKGEEPLMFKVAYDETVISQQYCQYGDGTRFIGFLGTQASEYTTDKKCLIPIFVHNSRRSD